MADMGVNELRVLGESGDLRRFEQQADERHLPVSDRDPYNGEFSPSVLSFHRLVPIPSDVSSRGYDSPGGGCEWQKTNWGVKWGAARTDRTEETDGLCYDFETAWYPPVPFLQTVSADHPSLTFLLNFTVPSGNWCEHYEFRGGNRVDENYL
jgi:hypothetical protein